MIECTAPLSTHTVVVGPVPKANACLQCLIYLCSPAQDFRECLEELDQQMADISGEVQQLERCTIDAISFEASTVQL